jgi:membrane protein DedA with SNARE-associated domain
VASEVIRVALYGAMGCVFADSWEIFGDLIGNLSGLLVGVVILGIGIFLAIRFLRRHARRPH